MFILLLIVVLNISYVIKFRIIPCNLKLAAAKIELLRLWCLHGRGEELSIANFHQGFTHVFELTFESVEGVAEYISHPEHVAYAEFFLPHLENFIVVDYTPK